MMHRPVERVRHWQPVRVCEDCGVSWPCPTYQSLLDAVIDDVLEGRISL